VDLIHKKDISHAQVGKNSCQVTRTLYGGSRRDLDAYAHFVGYDVGQRRFAQAWRTVNQDMIQRLAPGLGCLDQNAQVLLHPALANIVSEALGPKADVETYLFRLVPR
jgi:hypothetical protein